MSLSLIDNFKNSLNESISNILDEVSDHNNIEQYISSKNDPFMFKGQSLKILLQSKNLTHLEQMRNSSIPIVDYSDCEKKLKMMNIIDQSENLYSINTVYPDTLDYKEKKLRSDNLHSIIISSNFKIIEDSMCNNFTVKLPVKSKYLNISEYEDILLNKNISIFNENEEIFTDYCHSFSYYNNTDYTLNHRRKKFDLKPICSENGKFSKIDEYQYIECSYAEKPKDVSASFVKKSFDILKSSNFRLYKCFKSAFKNLKENTALILILTITSTYLIVTLLYTLLVKVDLIAEKIFNNDIVTIQPKDIGTWNIKEEAIPNIKDQIAIEIKVEASSIRGIDSPIKLKSNKEYLKIIHRLSINSDNKVILPPDMVGTNENYENHNVNRSVTQRFYTEIQETEGIVETDGNMMNNNYIITENNKVSNLIYLRIQKKIN